MNGTKKLITIAFVILVMAQCKSKNSLNPYNEKSAELTNNAGAPTAAHQHNSGDDSKYVSHQIKVSGDIENPLTLTVDSLKKMNVKTLTNFKVVCQSGLTKDRIQSTKGVLLKDILDKARIVQLNHKDRNFYIVARAKDDYKATFSWAEIYNNPTGDQVYVLFEQNGAPLKEKGEMIVVSATDTKTGPRHVKWLTGIEVKKVK